MGKGSILVLDSIAPTVVAIMHIFKSQEVYVRFYEYRWPLERDPNFVFVAQLILDNEMR